MRIFGSKHGIITKTELLAGFPQLDGKTADLLISEVDTDDDGGISFQELWFMIQSLVTANAHMKDAAKSNTTEATAPLMQSAAAAKIGDENILAATTTQVDDILSAPVAESIEGKRSSNPPPPPPPNPPPPPPVATFDATADGGSACCVIF